MKNKNLLALAFIGTQMSISVFAEPLNLTGVLVNNQKSIPQATIRIKELGLETTTDDSGKFYFENVETGNYTFDITNQSENYQSN